MGKIMRFAPTMLRNLFKKPVTTKYPAEPIHYPEGSRGHIEIDIDKCISCCLCMMNCPAGAIKVDRKVGSWDINRMDCVQCGYCTIKCPKKCLTLVQGYTEPGEEKTVDHFQRSPEAMEAERKKKAEAAAKAAAARKALAAKKAAAAAAAKAKPEAAGAPEKAAAKPAAPAAAKAKPENAGAAEKTATKPVAPANTKTAEK